MVVTDDEPTVIFSTNFQRINIVNNIFVGIPFGLRLTVNRDMTDGCYRRRTCKLPMHFCAVITEGLPTMMENA
ncbi:transmembrane protein [Arabidopsis thaliana]|uniref:Transmembrane protein n=1 Tax=Arabidopsis thaliana TaxID=3702 RepID=B3H5T9_ARATH|nr:uncharacterized protein AT5G34829 [Arabidopsis thaliana]AED93909.1 transmembrane protein [Arabidopsis thaliana]|eukprot:NP_001119307.1 transmembrane protein [Arabidopsis thaliana]